MMKKKSLESKPKPLQTSEGSSGQEKKSNNHDSESENEFENADIGVLQVGYIKIQYQKLDLIKQALIRFS